MDEGRYQKSKQGRVEMYWLKSCPKCRGDLCLEQDHYGAFQTCLQCGYLKELIDRSGNPVPAVQHLPIKKSPGRLGGPRLPVAA